MTRHDFALSGVYVAAVTPFAADGAIDPAGIRRLCEHVLDAGVAGIVVAGTTGEYYALSGAEREDLFRHFREAVGPDCQLIAGCNAGGTTEVVAYGLRARELGYDALMLSAPPTSLPTQGELGNHVEIVAREVGLPIVLYNYPARAGVEYGIDLLDELADLDQIVAIKEASGDFSRFLAMRGRLGERLAISCGSDDQALDYFAWGVRSWIAGTANVLPREHVAVLEAAVRGDLEVARSQFQEILPFIQEMESGRYNQKAKLGLELQGVAVGGVRLPLQPLDADDAARYTEIFAAARGGGVRQT